MIHQVWPVAIMGSKGRHNFLDYNLTFKIHLKRCKLGQNHQNLAISFSYPDGVWRHKPFSSKYRGTDKAPFQSHKNVDTLKLWLILPRYCPVYIHLYNAKTHIQTKVWFGYILQDQTRHRVLLRFTWVHILSNIFLRTLDIRDLDPQVY